VGFLRGHKESIQDCIVMKEAGFLLSCAYDKTIIVWKYEEEREVTRYTRSEELRCMDYLASMHTLFVGTNQKTILTISIEDLLAMGPGGRGAGVGNSSQFLDESMLQ
jgi:WD40 repeat protein